MIIGGYLAVNNKITAGEFIAFLSALTAAYRPLKSIADTKVNLHLTKIAGSIAYGTMDNVPKIVNSPNAIHMKKIQGNISFNNVFFNYKTQKNILNGINLQIKPLQSIALVGNSGSGKTTLLNLIARFYDISKAVSYTHLTLPTICSV